MSDASVTAIDGRAVVRVGGSELLDAYVGQAIVAGGQATASAAAAAEDADDAAQSAALAQTAALTAPNVFVDEASGRAGVADGRTFWTDLGAAGLGLYRRASANASSLINTIITAAMLASASGAALIGYSEAAIGSINRPVQAVLRDRALNPKNFGAIGDGQYHRISERYTTLAAAQTAFPFINDAPRGAPAYKDGVLQLPWTKDGSGNPVVLWQNRSLDWAGHQAALNAAAANPNIRGVVTTPIGYYVLSDPIGVPSFVTWEGESRHGCVLFNQNVILNAPQIVNQDPADLIATHIHNLSCYGGTHAINIYVTGEQAGCSFSGIYTALQTVTDFKSNILQTTKIIECHFGSGGSGYAIDVTGFPCNANEVTGTRATCGKSGLLRMRGVDGFHWNGGSMEGNGEWVRVSASISGDVLTIQTPLDGVRKAAVGDCVIGPGVPSGTVITALMTGTGEAGTYRINNPATVANRSDIYVSPATIDIEAGGTRATSVSLNPNYIEGTHKVVLRTVGVSGVSLDRAKLTWANNGEPYAFDTGTDIIAIGTNYSDKDLIGPLNMLLTGSSPQFGGSVNTWTTYGQNAYSVVTRPRDLSQGERFDVLKFTRHNGIAQAGVDNMHIMTNEITFIVQGYDFNGNERSIRKSYDLTVRAISNVPITATLTQTSIDLLPPISQTLIARVRDASNSELVFEVETSGFSKTISSVIYGVFNGRGAPTIMDQRLIVTAT